MNPLGFPCLHDINVQSFKAPSVCITTLFSPTFFFGRFMWLFMLVGINKLKKSITFDFKGLGVMFSLHI